ncbi:MAG: Ig-like domain repeat protein [Candidatus Lambdaproteobacteria bacterium]|nr:Ig-like domain repeat protein [Candidatus Lambdaproteobacteria bacterium]
MRRTALLQAPDARATQRTISGQILAVNRNTGEQQTYNWALIVSVDTFSIQTEVQLALPTAPYNFYFLMADGQEQYAGITPSWLILNGVNSVPITVHPVIGTTIPSVAALERLAKIHVDASVMAGFGDPSFGIAVDSGPDRNFAINRSVGLSSVYVYLPPGAYQFFMKFYDGALLRFVSDPAITIGEGGGDINVPLVPLVVENTYTDVPASTQATFHLVVPGVVAREAGGLENVDARFSLSGAGNLPLTVPLTLTPSGANLEGIVTIPGFTLGEVTWTLTLYDTRDTPKSLFGTCGQTIVMSADPHTVQCELTLISRALPWAPQPARLAVLVSDGRGIPGAIVSANDVLLGLTSDGRDGNPMGSLNALLPAGVYRVRATAADLSQSQETGVTLVWGQAYTVTLYFTPPPPPPAPPPPPSDTTAPVVTITSPTGTVVVATPLLGYISNEPGTETVYLDGSPVGTRSGGTLPALASGEHTIRVEVRDAAGNVGFASVTFSVLLPEPPLPPPADITPPTVTISAPVGTVTVATPLLSYTSDEPGIASVFLDGDPVDTRSGGMLPPLANGEHTVRVDVRDAAGNVGSASVTFSVAQPPPPPPPPPGPPADTTAPVVTITSPGATVTVATPLLTYASDEPGTDAVFLDGSPVGTRSGELLPALDTGDHTVRVEVRDAAGNVGFASVTFSVLLPQPPPPPPPVDVTPPQVSIGQPVGIVSVSTPVLAYTSSEPGTVSVQVDGAAVSTGNGEPLPALADGQHSVTVTVTDAAGNAGSAVAFFVVDTTAPAVGISQPVGLVTEAAPLLVYVTDPAAEVRVRLDDQLVGVASGSRLPALPDGQHRLVVEARDVAGNLGSATSVYTIDTTPPVVSVSQPAGLISVRTPPLVYSTDTAGSESVLLDGTAIGTRNGQNLPALADGAHTVEVLVRDAAGLIGGASSSFRVDATAPAVTIFAPTPGAILATRTTDLVFESDEDGTALIVVNETETTSLSVTARTLVRLRMGPLPDGENRVTITVRDAAGNQQPATVVFTVDATPPQVTIQQPSGSTSNPAPLLVYALSEPGTVNVLLDGAAIETRTGEALPAVADGPHSVTVEAADAAGNIGRASASFSVDTTAPTVTIESPADGSLIGTGTPELAFFSGEAGSATIAVNGAVTSTMEVLAATRTALQIGPLPEGTNVVAVSVRDAVGNLRTASARFTVDTLAPAVTITAPTGTVRESEPRLIYTVSESALETVLLDGAAVTTRSGQLLPPLADGTHTVAVRVTDAAGNAGESSSTFEVARLTALPYWDIEARRLTRPTRWVNGEITVERPTQVVIPAQEAITVFEGNPERYLVMLTLGDVRCVYLGGQYNASVGGLPELDLLRVFRSPVCGMGRNSVGDVITVTGSVGLRVVSGDPEPPQTAVRMRIETRETAGP